MRTSLAKHVPTAPWDDSHISKAACAAWHKEGVLLVRVDDARFDDIDRGMVEALGTKLYGRRDGA